MVICPISFLLINLKEKRKIFEIYKIEVESIGLKECCTKIVNFMSSNLMVGNIINFIQQNNKKFDNKLKVLNLY